MRCVIHVDGGARGNPGPGAAGVVLVDTDSGEPVYEAGYYLGRTTNNVAEYTGLIRALEAALVRGVSDAEVYSDSELMVRQINGQYRVKSPALKPMYEAAVRLFGRVDRWKITHVRREKNRRADQLANMAMDRKQDVVVVGGDGGEDVV